MANALILNLGGGVISLGRLIIGPGQSDTHALLRVEGGFAPESGYIREVALSRQHEAALFQFLLERASPPLPPTDLEGEQRLLGTILQKPALFEVLADQVTSEHFADPVHTLIWNVMFGAFQIGAGPTLDEVAGRLEGVDTLDQVGGSAYLVQLKRQMPLRPADAVIMARRIEHMGIERRGGETPPWEAA